MEREVGRGIGMGNTCKPMAVSFQCMTKSTTKKKKKSEAQSTLRRGVIREDFFTQDAFELIPNRQVGCVDSADHGSHFKTHTKYIQNSIYVITLYTLNLHSVRCQLYLNKVIKKKEK